MKQILCYGDSNTYGYDPETGGRFDPAVRWPGRLQILLGEHYHVIEEGCNGRTALAVPEEAPWKCGRSSFRAVLYSHRPLDLVILMLGTNDLKSRFSATPDQLAEAMRGYIRDVRSMVSGAQTRPAGILVLSPPRLDRRIASDSPFSGEFDEESVSLSRDLGRKYRAVAEEEQCLFLDADEYAQVSETDFLHLDLRGHRELSDALASFILQNEGLNPDRGEPYAEAASREEDDVLRRNRRLFLDMLPDAFEGLKMHPRNTDPYGLFNDFLPCFRVFLRMTEADPAAMYLYGRLLSVLQNDTEQIFYNDAGPRWGFDDFLLLTGPEGWRPDGEYWIKKSGMNQADFETSALYAELYPVVRALEDELICYMYDVDLTEDYAWDAGEPGPDPGYFDLKERTEEYCRLLGLLGLAVPDLLS